MRVFGGQRDKQLTPSVNELKRVFEIGASRPKLYITSPLLGDDRPERLIVTLNVRSGAKHCIGVRGTLTIR
ncbi:hypothetical protein R70199_07869 [Paraburkholderia domus]|nr:hypothetical protein R70199_07869 [Paraburkholderia domus]